MPIEFTRLDDPVQALPSFEPCCCLVIKCQKTCMLALQVAFGASFQPIDLFFYVDPKIIDHLTHIGIMLELTTVSFGMCRSFNLITWSCMLSSHRASTINNEPHKKSQKSLRRDKSAVMLRSMAGGESPMNCRIIRIESPMTCLTDFKTRLNEPQCLFWTPACAKF